jgi:hypothetical protein
LSAFSLSENDLHNRDFDSLTCPSTDLHKVEQILRLGDHVEVLLGRGDDGDDDLVAHGLLGVVLAQLQRLRDIVDELRMVGEEMHGVLHAFGAYGDADVVEAAEEGLPQLPVFDGQRRVFLTKRRYSRVTAVSKLQDKIHLIKLN